MHLPNVLIPILSPTMVVPNRSQRVAFTRRKLRYPFVLPTIRTSPTARSLPVIRGFDPPANDVSRVFGQFVQELVTMMRGGKRSLPLGFVAWNFGFIPRAAA